MEDELKKELKNDDLVNKTRLRRALKEKTGDDLHYQKEVIEQLQLSVNEHVERYIDKITDDLLHLMTTIKRKTVTVADINLVTYFQ